MWSRCATKRTLGVSIFPPSLREQKTKRIDVALVQVTRLAWDHLIWIWVCFGHFRPYNSFERSFCSRVVKDHQNFILSLLSSPWERKELQLVVVSPFLFCFFFGRGIPPKFPGPRESRWMFSEAELPTHHHGCWLDGSPPLGGALAPRNGYDLDRPPH